MAGTKLNNSEVQERIDTCFDLRYNQKYSQNRWVKYCHENYGDKSEQQYCQYWANAKEKYDDRWKEKLNQLLDPAVDELYRLIADEDPKIRQRAIDQIVKYTGNDIEKIEAKIEGNITLNWGDDAEE